jgi:hypothetical protein
MDRSLSKLGQPARLTLMCGLPLMLLALPGRGAAATLTGNCDTGGRIQAAVDAAHPGDIIQGQRRLSRKRQIQR